MNNLNQFTDYRHYYDYLYPHCVPDSTYGVTQFWAEEYWTWRQIQKIQGKYPLLDFTGLIDKNFSNHFMHFLIKTPHNNILGTSSFADIPENSWEISNKRFNLATSHAPSRYKAQFLLRRHKDKFGIITFDAHLDLGNYKGIHGAWLTKNLAKRTAIIGGWAETKHELKSGDSFTPFITSEFKQITEDNSFLKWIAGKKLYISIDLDYLRKIENFLGLSCYWHRNLIIGHTMNLNQQIQMLLDHIDLSTPVFIGKELGFFEDLFSFMEHKILTINSHIRMLVKIFEQISILLQSTSSSLLGLDLVEYSAICDWRQLTLKALLENFTLFENYLAPVYEKETSL